MHFFIHQDFFKKPTKLGLIATIAAIAIGLFFVWAILGLQKEFPVIKQVLDFHEDVFQLLILLVAIFFVGIGWLLGKAYRKFIKGIPRCMGCLNLLERYTIDLMEERIKCRSCGFQSTFYQFPDKIFLQDIFLKMLKNKDFDPIMINKVEQLAEKFENFEFSKRKNVPGS